MATKNTKTLVTRSNLTFEGCEALATELSNRYGTSFALRASTRRYTYWLNADGRWTFKYVEAL